MEKGGNITKGILGIGTWAISYRCIGLSLIMTEEEGVDSIILYKLAIGIFFRYIAEKTVYMYSKGDNFMGRLFYPLRSIHNSGEEKTFELHSHSGKTQRGYVTLQLCIKSKKKNPIEVNYLYIFCICMYYSHFFWHYSDSFVIIPEKMAHNTYAQKWNGELPPLAEKLLEHHAVLNDIDSLQQTCM